MDKFRKWADIRPDEVQARKSQSYIDIAALKVSSVFKAFECYSILMKFCNHTESNKNIGNKYSPIYIIKIQSILYMNSLYFINCCYEYMLQMLFCFCGHDNLEDYEHNKLEEKFKNSDMESLVTNLLKIALKTGEFAEKASINEIIALKKDIFEAADKYDIRKNNNHLKHRGMFNFKGLDDVNTFAYEKYGLMVDVIDVTSGDKTHCEPQRMMYEEYRNLKNEISKLQDFSEIFEDKFDQLINLVIPKNYVKPVGNTQDVLRNFIPMFDDLVFPEN